MDTGETPGVPCPGHDGLPVVGPAVGPPRHGYRSTGLPAAVPEPIVRAWESAYRQYGQVKEMTSRTPVDDPASAWHMATVSWAVAAAWREIATVARLPWWLLAAVEAAAEAFESQAREWEARENSAEAQEGGPS
jgi:hypothetical protein